MKTVIAVFKSKPEVMRFIEKMVYQGARAQTTGTPKEAKIGCGISARFEYRNLNLAKKILREEHFEGFHQAYLIETDGSRVSKRRLLL